MTTLPDLPARGWCPVCSRRIALRRDGTLRHHLGDMYSGGWREICAGVGRTPEEETRDA